MGSPHRCPRCGAQLLPVAWGYPASQTIEAAERGELVLGGCSLPPPEMPKPVAQCPDCDWQLTEG